MTDNPAPDNTFKLGRMAQVFLAGVVGVAVAGYFYGLTSTVPHPTSALSAPAQASAIEPDVPPAVPYRQMNAIQRGPNRNWENRLDKLATKPPDVFDPVQNTAPDKAATRAERAARRAYDGAPPVIPHPITQKSVESCLACHGAGLRVGDRIAPKLSHPRYASCTQCHVESQNLAVAASGPWAPNTFEGLPSPTAGDRAWQGAPPTIPHSTQMRSDCLSCHGTTGRPGMRSTHPWRQSCTQCHAPSAALDQQPNSTPPAPATP